MKRKIYQQLLDWKEKRNGEVALLVENSLASLLSTTFITLSSSVA